MRAAKPPRVAVLLAAYNGVAWLEEQVETILFQKEVDVQLIISVDQSSDGTEALVDRLADLNNNITVLPHGQRFGFAGPNFCRLIREACLDGVDYVAFSDQDDVWLDTKLAHSVRTLVDEGLDAYSADVTAFWPDGREQIIRKSHPFRRYDHYFESASTGCTYVFPIGVFKQIRHFITDNWAQTSHFERHDWLIYAFARARGFRWKIDCQPTMRYRQHLNNQVGTNSGVKGFMARFDKIRNGWYRRNVQILADLLAPIDHSGFRNERWFLIRNVSRIRRKHTECLFMLCVLLLNWY